MRAAIAPVLALRMAGSRSGAAAAATLCLLPVLVIAAWGSNAADASGPAEFFLFGPSGAAILLGDWSSVYDQATVQAGPLELLPFGVAQLVGVHGAIAWTVFEAAFSSLLMLGLLVCVLRLLRPQPVASRPAFLVALVVGAALALAGFVPTAVTSGHPAQVVVPVLWMLAARAALDRRFAVSGILIGLAAGWEIWGVLGAAVIFCAGRPKAVRAAAACIATLTVLYGPFVLTGEFRMFNLAWGVSTGSLVHALWPSLTTFPWSLRLAQAVAALVLGAAVGYALRGRDLAVFLVPGVILLVRILLDPLAYGYYYIAPAVVVAASAACAIHHRNMWLGVGACAGAAWVWRLETHRPLPSAALLVGVLGLAAWAGWNARGQRPEGLAT